MANIDERIEKITRSLETLEQTEARHNEAADARLTRIEMSLEKLTLTVNRIGKYAMVIARVHDDELHAHTRRLLVLEEEETDGDDSAR